MHLRTILGRRVQKRSMSTKRQVTSMFTVFALTFGLIAAAPVAANANSGFTLTRDGLNVTVEVDCARAVNSNAEIFVNPGETISIRNKPGTTCTTFTVRPDAPGFSRVGFITTSLPTVFTNIPLTTVNGVQERVLNISPTAPEGITSNRFAFSNQGTKGIGFVLRSAIAIPSISSASPTTLSTAGGTTVTITGSGFAPGATVLIGNRPCTNVTVVSSSSIVCNAPIGVLGPQNMVVSNPNKRFGQALGIVTYQAIVQPLRPNTTDFYADLSGATETSMRTVANQGPIPLRADFTLDFWVFDPSTRDNSRATIIAQSSSDTNNRLEIQVDGGSSFMDQELILIYRGSEHGTRFKLPQNTWTHITLLSNASTIGENKIWLRVDNHQVFEVVTDGQVDSPASRQILGPLFIGRASDDSAKQLFKGRVDQVKVWSNILNPDSIERSMHTWGAQGVQVGTTLLAHYDFNDRTVAGGPIYNRAANAHNMSLTASAGTSPFVDVKQTLPTEGKTTLLFPRSYLTQVGGWRAPNGVTAVQEALVVGGGGSGGYDGASGGGGGGAQFGSIPFFTQALAVRVGQGGVPGLVTTAEQGSSGQTSRLSIGASEIVNAAGGGRGQGIYSSTTRGTGGSSSSFENFTSFVGGSGGLGGNSTTQEKEGNAGTSTVESRFDKTYSFGGGGGAGIAIGSSQPTSDVAPAPGGLGGGGVGASVDDIGDGIHFCAALTGKGASAGGNATPNTGGGGGGGVADGNACVGTPNTRYDGERTAGGHGGSGVVIFGITSAVPFAPAPTFTVVATDNGTNALSASWSDMPNAATTRKVVQYRAGNGSWFPVFDSSSATSFSMPRTNTGVIEFRVTQFDAASGQFGEWVYSNPLTVNLYSGTELCENPLKLRYDITQAHTLVLSFRTSLTQPGISIRWGDGTGVAAFTTTSGVNARSKTFTDPGTYTVEVCGKFQSFGTNGRDLVEVVQWGEWVDNTGLTDAPARSISLGETNIDRSLSFPSRLTDVPATFPSTITSTISLFAGANVLNDPDIANWNVSNVTNMFNMFGSNHAFNQNISGWNVANVTNMGFMFRGARSFNQNISGWNVTNVTNMQNMLNDARAFNWNISAWDTINVTNFSNMLSFATSYTHKPPLKINAATNAANMLDMSGISDETYSRTILEWAALIAGTTRPATLALGAVDKTALCSVSGTAVRPQAKLLELVAGGWTVNDKTNRVADACATIITVTATSTTQRYGDPVPSVRFTPVVTGPLAADPNWVNQVTCSARVSADGANVTSSTAPANNYVTQCTGPASSGTGIDVVYVNGTHTVTTRPIEITIKNRIERKGSTFASDTTSLSNTNDRTEYAITSGDLVGTDELSVTISKGTVRAENANQFDLIGTLAAGGEGARYQVTFVPGVLTISDKTFIVTAKNQTKMFGDLFNLDNVDGWTCQAESNNPTDETNCRTSLAPVTLSSLGTSETANKGPYAITSSVTESSDRTVVNTNGGILTVTKRPITVTPTALTVNAGSAIPAYPLTISNWNSVLDLFQGNEPDGFESPTCTSGYTPDTPRDTTLAITCSGGNPGDNYYFVYESATLTVPGFTDVLFLTPDEVSANPSTGSVVVPFEFNITPFVRICYATLVVTNLSGNFEVVEGQPTNVIERRVLVDSSTLRFNLDLPEGEYEYKLLMDGNCAAEEVTRSLLIGAAAGSSSAFLPTRLMPQPQAINPSRALPGARTKAQIEGQNLGQVVRVRIGGKTIRFVTATETSLNFTIPRLKPGRYDILLVMRDGTTQRWQQQLRITGRSAASAPSREFAGFAAGSSTLTPAMRASITRYLNANKANFRTIECVGYTDGPFIRRTDVPLSMARAKEVCDLARGLGYEVTSRSYVNERTPGAQLRRVKLILGK